MSTTEAQKRATVKYLKKQRVDLIKFLGGFCEDCGFDDIRALQLDHINGGGCQEYKNGRNNEMYRYYNKHRFEAMQKFQVLCANCNWIKKSKNKEVRHE